MGTSTLTRRAPAEKITDTQRVLDSFRRIVQALRVASRAAEQQMGLSASQLFVLHKLSDGKATSLNELARRTLTHQSTVSVVVQRLVERNFVTRTRSEEDGRQIVLKLTADGRSALRKSPQATQEQLIDAINALPASKRKTLATMLTTVADSVSPGGNAPMLFADEGKRNGSH
jgi:DNA-binding MarR family transcriptional regulator